MAQRAPGGDAAAILARVRSDYARNFQIDWLDPLGIDDSFANVEVENFKKMVEEVVKDFLQPGLRFKPPYGALDLISLGLALIFGTAGLPHILVRFYTVPDAKTARSSVVWAMALIGSFYIMTTFLGFGAATIVGRDYIATHGGTNMSAPLLAQALAGNIFFAFISSIAFAG